MLQLLTDVTDSELMKYDFDVHVDFEPNFGYGKPHEYFSGTVPWFKFRLKNKINELFTGKSVHKDENLFDYRDVVESRLSREETRYKEFPCVTPGWDNSPRRVGKPFYAIVNNTPEMFSYWLKNELARFTPYSDEENFVFINAWNEWAEGNHLEPDQKWGKQFLEATKEVIKEGD